MVQVHIANNVYAVAFSIFFIRDLEERYSLRGVSPAYLPQPLGDSPVRRGVDRPDWHMSCQLLQIGIRRIQHDCDCHRTPHGPYRTLPAGALRLGAGSCGIAKSAACLPSATPIRKSCALKAAAPVGGL
jgi:hypothetical protein